MATAKQTKLALATLNKAASDRLLPLKFTEDNFAKLWGQISGNEGLFNMFMPTLLNEMNRLATQMPQFHSDLVNAFVVNNDADKYGNFEQEVILQPGVARDYDPIDAAQELNVDGLPDLRAAYHPINYQKYIPLWISRVEMQKAFAGPYELFQEIENIMGVHIYGARAELRQTFLKQALEDSIKDLAGQQVIVDAGTSRENSIAIVKKLRAYIGNMGTGYKAYNAAGVKNSNTRDTLYLILTNEMNAELEVDVEGFSFNSELVRANIEKVLIDEFDDTTIKAVIADKQFLKLGVTFDEITENNFGARAAVKYFGHDQGRVYYSPFRNSVVFRTSTPEKVGKTINLGYNGGVIRENFDFKATFAPQLFDGVTKPEKPLVAEVELVTSTAGSFQLDHYVDVDGLGYLEVKATSSASVGDTALIKFTLKYSDGTIEEDVSLTTANNYITVV